MFAQSIEVHAWTGSSSKAGQTSAYKHEGDSSFWNTSDSRQPSSQTGAIQISGTWTRDQIGQVIAERYCSEYKVQQSPALCRTE